MLKQVARRGVYTAVDAVTLRRGIRRRINDETIRFPPDVSRYYPASYEPATHAFIRRDAAPGTAAVDAAHIGLFTVLMARAGPDGRVLSFEPTATTARLLRRTIALNGLGGIVSAREEAVAGERGVAEFFVDEHDASNANSFLRRPRDRVDPRADGLDRRSRAGRRAADVLPCLKIDVEGAELDALWGARRTLETDRPALALDIHSPQLRTAGGSVAEIWDLLEGAGYESSTSPAPWTATRWSRSARSSSCTPWPAAEPVSGRLLPSARPARRTPVSAPADRVGHSPPHRRRTGRRPATTTRRRGFQLSCIAMLDTSSGR
jgi:FkbM family methyltransferase